MYALSHIALFYFLGKSTKAKELWLGMLTAILPDIALVIFGFCNLLGLNCSGTSSHPVNLFLHSIFPILFFIPLIFFDKKYFYTGAAGYSFHLLLDYMTHSAIRMPLYPIVNWKIPIFVISYFNVYFLLIIKIVILLIFLVFFGKIVVDILRSLAEKYDKAQVRKILIFYIIMISILGVLYTNNVLNLEVFLVLVLVPVVIIITFFIGILFIVECYENKWLKKQLDRILNKYFRSG